MTKVVASVDALRLCQSIGRASGCGAAAAELHAFAYLACLLSVYERRPAEQWGYQFHATPAGSPYAPELDEAISGLRAAGLLVSLGDALAVSDHGSADLRELERHYTAESRLRYLDAASATAVLMPLPSVTSALGREPQLERVLGAPKARNLLDNAGRQLIAAHFEVISTALSDDALPDPDLAVAAAVWLMALAEGESA